MLFLTIMSALTAADVAANCRTADVMITLDVSGTMVQTTGSPAKSKYTRAKDAISSVLTAHQDEGAFGLYLFPEPAVAQSGVGADGIAGTADDNIKPGTGFCNMSSSLAVSMLEHNKTAIMNKLNAITPSGKNDTPIYQALLETGDPSRYPNSNSRRRAAILITDGMQDCCRGPFPDTPNEANDCYPGTTTLSTDERFNNNNSTIQLAYQLEADGMQVWVVGFGDKVDTLMLAGIGHAFKTEPNRAQCDPYDLAKAKNCFYNIDAGDTTALTTALNAIVQQIQSETCNGLDDDCDGSVDEGITEACQNNCSGAGVKTCVNGHMSECSTPAATEMCDGVDNDCDGNKDKIPCTTACHTPGFRTCMGSQMGMTCVSTVPVQAEEICNGTDDDCDGVIDEGCSCTNGTTEECTISAECPGVKTCMYGKLGVCTPTKSSPEVCNGKDDDCDGKIDVGPDLCAKGSRCVDGHCTSGIAVEEIAAESPSDIEKYRGSGFIKGCNAQGFPLWILVFAIALVRRRD